MPKICAHTASFQLRQNHERFSPHTKKRTKANETYTV